MAVSRCPNPNLDPKITTVELCPGQDPIDDARVWGDAMTTLSVSVRPLTMAMGEPE